MRKQSIATFLGSLALLIGQMVFISSPAQALLSVSVNPLSAGTSSTCAIRASDDLYCVGSNTFGQLGNGSLVSNTEPQKVIGISRVSSVSVGATSACAINQSSELYCWGDNSSGQLGIGTTESKSAATLVSSLQNVSQVAVGDNFACALTNNGTVYCWGANDFGQLTTDTKLMVSSPTAVAQSVTGVTSVSVFGKKICALSTDVYCWGDFDSYIFPTETRNWVPTKLAGSASATSVELGSNFGCITFASSVSCWGNNDHGQLGNGTKTQSAALVTVTGIGAVKDLAVGNHFACVIDLNQDTFCWGENQAGQLVVAAGADQVTRVPTGAPKSVALDAGLNNFCLLKVDGAVGCYGDASSGQSGYLTSSQVPVMNSSIVSVAKVSTGLNTTCAIDSLGLLNCWGVVLPELSKDAKFTDVSVSNTSACAVTIAKKVMCWGSNSSGQLGNNSNRASAIPVPIDNSTSNFVSVASGNRHACALSEDGLTYCWGDNSHQQLGFVGDASKSPKAVPGIGTAVSVAVGDYHSCVLLANGTVTCWGDNAKKQINTSSPSMLAPTSLVTVNLVSKVSLGANNTCLLDSTKNLRCFGDNAKKQSPVSITGTFSDVSAQGNTVCAVRTDETVACFGAADSGKLGIVSVDTGTPATIAGLTAAKVSVGTSHVCSLDGSAKLKCWGSNTFGQLTSSFGFPAAFAALAVSIQGPRSVGELLSANITGPEYSTTLSYAWKRSSTLDGYPFYLPSETGQNYLVAGSDQSKFLAVEVKQSKWGLISVGYVSDFTQVGAPIRLLMTPVPTVSGIAKIGKRLIAASGRWDSGATLSYQWFRGKTAIKGANKILYQIVAADVGKQIYVTVKGLKPGLPSITTKSEKTKKVVR